MNARLRPTGGDQRRDPLQTLTALRPPLARDDLWSSAERDALLHQILDSPSGESVPLPRHASPTPRPRHPRRTTVIGLSALTLVGGAGTAAAAGLVPEVFTHAFSGWRTWHDPSVPGGDHPVDPAAARRVATASGPQGTVFSVVAARAADDPSHICLDALYESRASTGGDVPADFEDVLGDRCQSGPARGKLGAAAEGSVVRAASVVNRGLGLTEDTLVWSMAAGGATSASVRTGDGQAYPVVVFDGQLFGWVSLDGGHAPSATITAYDAKGTVIGRVDLAGNHLP